MATVSSGLIRQGSRNTTHLHRPQLFQALFSTKSSSKPGNSTWERSAKRVKDTDVTDPYLDKIRAETVDSALQLKTIEDELCGAIGKALGKQGDKVLAAIRDMTNEHMRYTECIESREFNAALEFANRHNEARKRAIKARWELLVHRQAVGFTVDNHSVVHETFPIHDALPDTLTALDGARGEHDNLSTAEYHAKSNPSDLTKEKFPDQLDWWRTRGRWK
ncbi:hypothetical protein ACHAWO_005591 [Cyclotella atomus]|uniref:Uncharacterized protein n=1 Tax=Cyclotella atomus TaxID=382360 RepID=A0ABD3QT99_9STRA